MSLRFNQEHSRWLALDGADIDTDQILPARYLATQDSQGLGQYLFQDHRYHEDGKRLREFPLNPPYYQGQSILLVGPNFGCGSSREHAPWALRDFGIRVLIGTSFGEIFLSNCFKNGILPICLPRKTWQELRAGGEDLPLKVDLEKQSISSPAMECHFSIDPFFKHCLLGGFDELDFILNHGDQIEAFEGQAKSLLLSVTLPEKGSNV